MNSQSSVLASDGDANAQELQPVQPQLNRCHKKPGHADAKRKFWCVLNFNVSCAARRKIFRCGLFCLLLHLTYNNPCTPSHTLPMSHIRFTSFSLSDFSSCFLSSSGNLWEMKPFPSPSCLSFFVRPDFNLHGSFVSSLFAYLSLQSLDIRRPWLHPLRPHFIHALIRTNLLPSR